MFLILGFSCTVKIRSRESSGRLSSTTQTMSELTYSTSPLHPSIYQTSTSHHLKFAIKFATLFTTRTKPGSITMPPRIPTEEDFAPLKTTLPHTLHFPSPPESTT